MSVLYGSENDFLRSVISVASKGSDVFEGALCNGTLYIIVNNGLVYTINVSSYLSSYEAVSFTKDSLKQNNEYIDLNERLFKSIIDRCYNITILDQTSELIFDDPNLRLHQEFEDIINAKTTDGSFRYYIDSSLDHRTFVIIQKNMFNLTKQDSISLKVYNLGANILLANFEIYKKKLKLEMKLHFMFTDLMSPKKGQGHDITIK